MIRGLRINNEHLREIRSNTDWRLLFQALGLEKDEKKSRPDDWWALSPFTEEKTASFHMNDNGFYCHSTKESGGVIELVQACLRHRMGKTLNCYEAGKWLLEQGVSSLSGVPEENGAGKRSEGKTKPVVEKLQDKIDGIKPVNKPIRQNLIPTLSQLGEHPEFVRRGISEKTCKYLGCGYLEKAKGDMKGRIIFQVRGLELKNGDLSPVILTHIGRATNSEQEESGGKWKPYRGFMKRLELYNIDQLFLDPKSVSQVEETSHVLIVEGCFDVAKLVEAGIRNVVATLGSHLTVDQIPRLLLIKEQLGDVSFLLWYDRDPAGRKGQEKALELLKENELASQVFDWEMEFPSRKRGAVAIPDSINDVCDFSVEQLRWLRSKNQI